MSAARLHALRRGVRRRVALHAAAVGLPAAVAAGALAWRLGGVLTGAGVAGAVAIAVAAVAWALSSRYDLTWVVRALDARRRDLEDSTGLLLATDDTLTPLERLQRVRLQQRIEAGPLPELRPRPPAAAIALACVLATSVVAAAWLWPTTPAALPDDASGPYPVAAGQGPFRLLARTLRVAPPAYTGLPARELQALDVRAPASSRLRWTLRFAPAPRTAQLALHDGRRVPLTRDGEDWIATHTLARSALYRVLVDGEPLPGARLHRLDAVPDRPPQVRVIAPERSLTLASPGQRVWPLVFEATDDHGVAATARLRITLAQGSGEQVAFAERTFALRGPGPAKRRRFAQRLDLAALGFATGDDLIAQLEVRDERAPSPQSARSASVILRWPPESGSEAAGIEGLVKKVMPAYFRSQRQIILDAEALLKQRRGLDAETFASRSDAIGVDQRILRLRYGQFLGEETEDAPNALPTNDLPIDLPIDDADSAPARDDAHGHDDGPREHAPAGDTHGHDHAESPADAAAGFGREADVLETYGHTHDDAEAATLLDPETRATLKKALDQMWQSELHLRQGQPDRALPYAYRALEFIKQVQQATRIYLARVGSELPPIDVSRRLSGERAGIANRAAPVAEAPPPDVELVRLWQALDDASAGRHANAGAFDLAALERWLGDHQARLADPLAFVQPLEGLRTDPECVRCRRELRALLWPLLPRPAPAAARRDGGDEAGRRYLEALQGGER